MTERVSSSVAADELKEATKCVLAKLERLVLDSKPERAEKPSRTRNRVRKNKQGPDEVPLNVAVAPVAGPSRRDSNATRAEPPIDYQMQFLLEVLRLPQASWADHFKSLCLRKGVIVKEASNKVLRPRYVWNADYEGNEHTMNLVESWNNKKGGDNGEREKKRRFLNLDETINELISDVKLHVSLSPNRIRSEAELDKAMKKVVSALEAAGLGSEDEGELFITRLGRTAFVRTDPEVVIRKRKLLRCALNGDIVRVFIFKDPNTAKGVIKEIFNGEEEEDEVDEDDDVVAVEEDEEAAEELAKCSATGFVIRIVKQVHERSCVGAFRGNPTSKTQNLVFFPHEMGIPPVNVTSRSLASFIPKDVDVNEFYKTLPQRLFEVELTSSNSFYNVYNGRVLADLGTKGNLLDENSCILLRHGFKIRSIDRLERLGETYVTKAAGGEDAEVNRGERQDLTQRCIFTIDPATAKDLDDAVSCRNLDNGNIEVGIHISDVTHYVIEDSDLDLLVQQAKTTSVYMVDKVYHMLPSSLCQTCSLLPGEKKRAVSVFIEMTKDAQIVNTSFTRSVINSACQMSYEQAQKVIDGESPLSVAPLTIYNGYELSDIRGTIKSLHGLAVILRERRMRNGALKFDKPKYYFRLDEKNEPIQLLSETSKPANHLIEEFMILANEVVGKYIFEQYPEWAILRQHSPPKLDQMAKVQKFFRDLEFPDLNYKTAQDINTSMELIIEESKKRGLDQEGFQLVLNSMLAKPMNRAQYFCTGDNRYVEKFEHFALSIPFYTHFTSPIRRYPDIMVHRLLIRAINGQPPPKNWRLTDVMDLMADCNRQKMNARYASEDSGRLFLIHYLRNLFPEGREMRATVNNVLLHSMEVKLWETGDELNIQFAEIEAQGYRVKRKEDGVVVLKKKAEKETQGGEGKDSDAATEESPDLELKIFSTVTVRVVVEKEHLRAASLVL